ncbi:MAG: CAP domain-containing protein [Candidatus Berkelbacteria bacterium]|nr:CAP domain-containing protein [Candidatus Berkelbacteria bacterium]
MKKIFKPVLIASVFTFIIFGSGLIIINSDKTSASTLVPSDQISLNLVNNYRTQNHLSQLKWNDKLAKAADDKAQDILNKQYFDHTSPDGKKAWDFILSEDYSYRFAGENLGVDFDSQEQTFDAWLNSPSHLANIASKNYSDFGFAELTGNFEGRSTNVFVQMFGKE